MKRPLIATALAAATVLGSVVMVHSQDAGPKPPSRPQGAADMGGPGSGPSSGPRRDVPPAPRPGPRGEKMHELAVFDLAGKLAAAEIYIGVKPEQLAVWRGYTEALLDLVSSDGMPPPPGSQEMGDAQKADTKLPGEELALLVLTKFDKAKALQEASGALRSQLSAAQLDKLAELDRNLMRRPPPPGGPEPDGAPFDAPDPGDPQPRG